MQKQQVLTNAAMSVLQIIVISVALFILYRFLLGMIGVQQFGVWSLVLATTSVANIANFGLSGGVVKFVAKYVARDEPENVSKVIQTAALSVALFVGIILLVGYPFIKWVLGFIVPPESLHLAILILPYTIWALWIMIITATLQSGLDGLQRIDLRSGLLIGGTVFHLILCFLIVPRYGLLGLAYARVAQITLVLVSSWVLLRKSIKILPIIPNKWDIIVFKEIFFYGSNFQIISVMRMLLDPITKALLSRFGGLSTVGYYEMASRLVTQLRSLILSANRVLVPTFAEFKEKSPEKITYAYLTSYRLVFYLSLPLFTLLIITFPLISKVWIGHYERTFISFGMILSIGWLVNLLSGPSYIAYLGIGELRWNVAAHIVIAMLNIALGFLFGFFYGGMGVVVACVIAVMIGSSIICVSYNLKYKISIAELLPRASRIVLLACFVSVLFDFLVLHQFKYDSNFTSLNILTVISFLVIVTFALWFHPMRNAKRKS